MPTSSLQVRSAQHRHDLAQRTLDEPRAGARRHDDRGRRRPCRELTAAAAPSASPTSRSSRASARSTPSRSHASTRRRRRRPSRRPQTLGRRSGDLVAAADRGDSSRAPPPRRPRVVVRRQARSTVVATGYYLPGHTSTRPPGRLGDRRGRSLRDPARHALHDPGLRRGRRRRHRRRRSSARRSTSGSRPLAQADAWGRRTVTICRSN